MIEFKDLSVSIDKKNILDSISLVANNREITAVLGRNGSGKTTLLSSVFKERKYSGSILVDGRDISLISRKELAKKVSIMPQNVLSPDITVESLVSYGRTPYTSFSGILTSEDREKVYSAIKEMGLYELSQRKVSSLSGGECRRAYFAMILAGDADTVMLDEPTTFMDAVTKKELFAFIDILKKRNKAVIIVLHDLTDAVKVSDRIYLIDGGKTIFSGSGTEFADSSYPTEIFGLEAVRIIRESAENIFFI